MSRQPSIAFTNARLVDPASGYDGPGALLVSDGVIAEVRQGAAPIEAVRPTSGVIDVQRRHAVPRPGRPPGQDRRARRRDQGDAEVGGAAPPRPAGVTSIVVQPDTDPVIDEPSVVDFILRRARDIELVHVYPAGAATKGLEGQGMAEIGLMHEAGCVYVTDADRPIVDSKVMRRRADLRRRPRACWSPTARPTPGSPAARRPPRASSPAAWACPACRSPPRRIMLERDLALVELTGARLLVDQISTAGAAGEPGARQGQGPAGHRHRLDQPPDLQRARHRRLPHLLQARPAAARARTTARR